MFTGLASPVHLLLLLLIILLLFGAKRIPDLARSLGNGAREFREGINAAVVDDKDEEKPSLDGAARDETPRAKEAGATRHEQKS